MYLLIESVLKSPTSSADVNVRLCTAGVLNLPYIPSSTTDFPSYYIRFTLESDDGSQFLLPTCCNAPPTIFIDDSGIGVS